MCEDWTKCEQCKFFNSDKYYCNRMLRTVTIGCPYGEELPLKLKLSSLYGEMVSICEMVFEDK